MRVRSKRRKLRRGELVQVLSEAQIRDTLDAADRREGLPWMAEMAQYCGRTFRVYRRAEKVFLDHYCYVGRLRNTVLLEGVRCSGTHHGGCQMGCLLLWKEDWLQPAPADAVPENPAADELDAPASTVSCTSPRLDATSSPPGANPPRRGAGVPQRGATMPQLSAQESEPAQQSEPVEEPEPGEQSAALGLGVHCTATALAPPAAAVGPQADEQTAAAAETALLSCQATALVHATEPLPWWRPGQYVADLFSGELGLRDFGRMLLLQVYNKLRHLWGGRRFGDPRGTCRRTPRESLQLQPGEWVEVKSLPEIMATLDRLGRNRGLGFGPEMVQFCGRRLRVARRVERLIVEWTGSLRTLSDTVALGGALCDGLAFRGCPRACYHLWREIWLRRIPDESQEPHGPASADTHPS